MVKKLLTGIIISALTFTASAQNARLDAMGQCDITSDITNIMLLPSYVNDYEEQIQGTATGANSYGPVFAIKSLGDVMNAGIMALQNNGSGSGVLRGNFYNRAVTRLNTLAGPNTYPAALPMIPHLLLGFDFDAFLLGIDMYFEGNRYKSIIKNGPVEIENNSGVHNAGGKLSAEIRVGDFSLIPVFGISSIDAHGDNENPPVQNLSTEGGIFLTAGGQVSFGSANTKFIGGFFYTLESYQFQVNTLNSDKYRDIFMDAYMLV